jgi:hypothetical protein
MNQITSMTAPTATKTWMGRVMSPPQKALPAGVGKDAGGWVGGWTGCQL